MITVRNINYNIGGKKILNNISIDIETNKITAILGANGAGKSSLLKCLTGSLKADEGKVIFDNKILQDYSLNELSKRRAVLSQSNPISFPFTTMEIVMMGRNPYASEAVIAEDNRIVQEVLEATDCWHLRSRVFPTLSGGEQQRVHLARVLAQIWEQDNACIFLDEPTSALDLKHQHQVLSLAKDLSRNQNLTVCLILHDIHLARHYADNAILMKNGEIHISGKTSEIMSNKNIADIFEIPIEFLTANINSFTKVL